jgi:hypothetical protein
LKELFVRKKLVALAQELDEGVSTFKDYLNRTKAQWKEVAGVSAGIDIYNYLHPRQGIEDLI